MPAHFFLFISLLAAAFGQPSRHFSLSCRSIHNLRSRLAPLPCTKEVRKTLILGHIRLGRADEGEDGGGLRPAGGAGASRAEGEDGSGEVGRGDQGAERGKVEGEKEDCEVRREIRQWYSGLSVYEVAVTPWRGGTPLARLKLSKKKSEAAQTKGGAGGRAGSGKKRGRGGGEGGRDSAANGEKHVNRQQNA